MKKCTKCGEVKELSEFYKRKGAHDGHKSACKLCCVENGDKRSQRAKKYYAENRDLIRKKHALYDENHRDAAKIRTRLWYENNKDRHRLYNKNYRKSNPLTLKSWSAKHKKISVYILSDTYVISTLGMTKASASAELIELKREQLLMHRATKQLTKEIENGTK